MFTASGTTPTMRTIVLSLTVLLGTALGARAGTEPALVLCADTNVFDGHGQRLSMPGKVQFWGDVRGPTGGPDAKPNHRWFKAVKPQNQPTLVPPHHGRSWIRFDGDNQWLTLGQVLDSGGLEKIPTNTVFVVFSSTDHRKTSFEPAQAHQPPATPDNPRIITDPDPVKRFNPAATIIGDQSFSVFGELGLAKRSSFLIPTKTAAYRWTVSAGTKDDGGTAVTYEARDRNNGNATQGGVHVLAVTHAILAQAPPRLIGVRLFLDGVEVFSTNPQAGSAVGMTCIGGGWAEATNVAGHDVPGNFQHASRLFRGDVAAVLAYDRELKCEQVSKISESLLRNPDACEQLGGKLRRLDHFLPYK
jgi:hypothetical protein